MSLLIKARSANFIEKLFINKTLRLSSQIKFNSTQSVEPALSLPKENVVYSDKIKQIVDDISKLTILEVSNLNDLLKKTLNIPDAPIMASMATPVISEKKEEEEEKSEKEMVKSAYIVKMVKFDPTKKVALIKEIKGLLEGMNLVQAKKFVESTPQVIKTEVPKEEAEKLKAQLEAAGATITLV